MSVFYCAFASLRYNFKNNKNNLMSSFNNSFWAGLIFFACMAIAACQTGVDKTTQEKNGQEYDCSASETLAAAKANNKPWSMSGVSNSGDIVINFSCKSGPFVGGFQQCEIQLSHLKQAVFADAISIDGGMKAHGHGLPTVPTLSPTADTGRYKLEGLKYSMPGAWTVGFRVNLGGKVDQVVFDFTI